jgi:hypothetical protein
LKNKAYVISAVCCELLFIKSGNVLAVNKDLALVAGIHAAEHIKYSSFSSTACAYYNSKFALFYLK